MRHLLVFADRDDAEAIAETVGEEFFTEIDPPTVVRETLAGEDDQAVADLDERTDRAADAVEHRYLVDPGGSKPIPCSADRRARELVEKRLPVREVAVDGCSRDPGRSGDVAHAGLTAGDEHVRRRVDDRRSDALLKRLSRRGVGLRRDDRLIIRVP